MSTKKIHYDGNVGIGTTSPEDKLDVSGSTRLVNPAGRSLMLERDNEDSWLTFHDPGNAWYSMGLDSSDGKKFKLNYGGSLGEGNVNHFTMLSDGKIGIGTNNPAYALDVNGTINAKKVLVDGQPLTAGGGGGSASTPGRVEGDISLGHFWEGGENTTGVNMGKPDSSGRWGGGSAFVQFQDSNVDGVNKGTSISLHTHKWGGGTNETFRVAANGNVGIGKSEPSNKLDISGSTRLTNPTGRSLLLERDNEDSWLTFHDPGNAWYSMGLDFSDERKFKLNYGGSLSESDAQHFTMLSDGKIGIGTNNPAHTLDVNGTINARGGIRASNSDIYFTKRDHAHTGIGNEEGWAAIENAADYDALMIMGRAGRSGRRVRLWDYLEINGNLDVTGAVRCTSLTQTSDGRFKKAIKPIQNALEKVTNLTGVTYEWKDETMGKDTEAGLVAQEVEAVFPEVVRTDSEGNKSIAYSKLTAVLIEAVKELKNEVMELRSQVAV